jgi:hypothetical protein
MARPTRKIKISAMITKDEYAAAVETAKKMRSARANGLVANLRLSILSAGESKLMSQSSKPDVSKTFFKG